MGKSPIEAEIRTGGGKSWIQIDGKWYDLPADALSSTTGTSLPSGVSTSNLDAGKILAAIGDPAKLLDNASVSSEKVEGIDSDKVSGDVNIAGVAAAAPISRRAWATARRPLPSQAEIDKTVTQLKKVVNKAHVDLWVGKSDHKVHRVAFTRRRRDGRLDEDELGHRRGDREFRRDNRRRERARHLRAVLGRHAGGVPGGRRRPARQGHGRRRRG